MRDDNDDENVSRISRVRKNGEKIPKGNGLIRIGDVKIEKIEWLWEPYIPLGRVSMLGGDPGAGKSFITTALASALSNGAPFPGEKEGLREPMVTLLLSVEDDPADTIRPRLQSLGANLCLIYISMKDIELSSDGLDDVKSKIQSSGAKLLIIDPIVAFMGATKDMNRATDVRTVMRGLANIARELKIAILVVRHNRKENANSNNKAIYAGMGSIDFTASVRSEMAVVEAKNGVKFLNHIKANSGMKGRSITYSITSAPDGSPLFKWGEFTNWPPLGGGSSLISKISKTAKAHDKIKLWLHDILKDHPEGLASNIVFELGRVSGHSDTAINKAKIGIARSIRRGDQWYWALIRDTHVAISPDDGVE